MAKAGPIGVTLRLLKVKRTKSEPNKPGRKRRKKYRGQGRP